MTGESLRDVGEDGSDDYFHVPEYGRQIIKSPEAMTRWQLQAEYAEGINFIPADQVDKIAWARANQALELPLCHSDIRLEQRREELEAAIHHIGVLVAESDERAPNGSLRMIRYGQYRQLLLTHAYADIYRARLEGRPLTETERSNIYQGMAQITRGALIEMRFSGFEDMIPQDMIGEPEEGYIGGIHGSLAEFVAMTASARPGSKALLVPANQGFRNNDVGVLFTDARGRELELAADIKVHGRSGNSIPDIRVGRQALKAVHPGEQLSGAERSRQLWESIKYIANILIFEQRGHIIDRGETSALHRFMHSQTQRIAQLSELAGVPDLLERVRY